jgi:hypothetical protein
MPNMSFDESGEIDPQSMREAEDEGPTESDDAAADDDCSGKERQAAQRLTHRRDDSDVPASSRLVSPRR